jgi:protein gp37
VNDKFWDKGIMLITGCKKVSTGCKECWSEKQHVIRSGQKNEKIRNLYNPDLLSDGKFNGKVQFNLYLLEKAAKVKKPHVYAIWNDLYHEGLTLEQQLRAFNIMARSPQHTFLIVTKRPENAVRFAGHWGLLPDPVTGFTGSGEVIPDNTWHIVTVENQNQANKRIPDALKIPGKRGIIIEPMLGAVDLTDMEIRPGEFIDSLYIDSELIEDDDEFHGATIHQVILGPENGTGKRPFNPEWADSVKAQCEATGVPFYRKDTAEGKLAWRVNK